MLSIYAELYVTMIMIIKIIRIIICSVDLTETSGHAAGVLHGGAGGGERQTAVGFASFPGRNPGVF